MHLFLLVLLPRAHPSTNNRRDCQTHIEWRIRCCLACMLMMLSHCIYCGSSKRCWWIYNSSMAPINSMSQYQKQLWIFVVEFPSWSTDTNMMIINDTHQISWTISRLIQRDWMIKHQFFGHALTFWFDILSKFDWPHKRIWMCFEILND